MPSATFEATQLPLFADSFKISPAQREVRGDDQLFLRSKDAQQESSGSRPFSVVDLFAGCGGISLGVREAAKTLGYDFSARLAVDFDSDAHAAYVANFKPVRSHSGPVEEFFDGNLNGSLTSAEHRVRRETGEVHLLVGGPPCQGHSDLNNYARRNDPKNAHYLRMARAAEVLEPDAVLIENVVGAAHDKQRVVQRTEERLQQLGYETSIGIIDCAAIGVPQKRRRLILLGSKLPLPQVQTIEKTFGMPKRNVDWAIGDLSHIIRTSIFDEPANSAAATRARIEFLFERGLYELPNEQRPACHRDKKHSYNSIYGRLSWDQPAQTITSGFYSMCMGRYVHPSQPRTLTAHEAARLQFFPDFFDFSSVSNRTSLARIIGNAVPVKLAYVATLAILQSQRREDDYNGESIVA